jgi:serine/threonine protein phosphatase 1
MMGIADFLLRRLATGRSAIPQIAPGGPLYVVGDIHGRIDLLDELLSRIASADPETEATLVFAGDYVDRGMHSREVIARLRRLQVDRTTTTVCLRGNHEAMMLDFLDSPARCGPRWLRNGGIQTLQSYGVAPPRSSGDPDPTELAAARDALRSALTEGEEDWLRSLPLIWRSGNLAVVHAAADPRLPIDAQDEEVLLWARGAAFWAPREDGIWIAHGHTPVEEPELHNGRIAVDTGAVFTDRLTAAHICDGAVHFIST